jgi:hypothetical protein
MLTFWGIVTAATMVGGAPTVGGLWLLERRRSLRRNRKGRCASCGTSWASTRFGDPYLIHGRLVCQDCAQTARRRMPWHFGFLGLAAGTAAAGIALAEGGLAAGILVPVGSTVAMTLGAVHLMKAANRAAQRLFAAGKFPDLTE